mmetsp:Transcript_5594/g.10046  ORF Transcript_5594/g.10046 Transcript_5594/m.10046 type:complete len:270 (-) Transcript_5594:724-1533(-)
MMHQGVHVHTQFIGALLSKIGRLACRRLLDGTGGMLVGTGGEDGSRDRGAETILEGDEVAETTADCGERRLWLRLFLWRFCVFGVDGDEVGPVGRPGEEAGTLDEHGIVHDDPSVAGVEGRGGNVIGDGTRRRGEVICLPGMIFGWRVSRCACGGWRDSSEVDVVSNVHPGENAGLRRSVLPPGSGSLCRLTGHLTCAGCAVVIATRHGIHHALLLLLLLLLLWRRRLIGILLILSRHGRSRRGRRRFGYFPPQSHAHPHELSVVIIQV